MNPQDLGYRSLIFFFLIFARLAGILVQAPLFGRPKGVPMQTQIGYNLVISIVIFHVLPMPAILPTFAIDVAWALLKQVFIGLAIGLASYTVLAGLQFGGELCDGRIETSNIIGASPSGTTTLIRQAELRLGILIWIMFHGDYFFFKAIFRSYELIPPTMFAFSNAAVGQLVSLTGQMFIVGLAISAPVMIASYIAQGMLGILARTSPQANVFMLVTPLGFFTGVAAYILSLHPQVFVAIPNLWDHFNRDFMNFILSLKLK